MTSVTFPQAITGRATDTTYSDDNDPNTGMADGGHQERWMPLMQDVVAAAAYAATHAILSGTDAATASAAATIAIQNQLLTQAAQQQAQYYSETAAAYVLGNITLNDQTITNDQTIPQGKNGMSVGPIKIVRDVTVKISRGSTWSIIGPSGT